MDHDSFADVIREHKDAIYGYARYLLGNDDDGEDVTQDVFIRLWRERDRVPEGARRSWLFRVCRNACIDQMRRREVRNRGTAATRVASQAWGLAARRGAAVHPILDVTDRGRQAVQMERQLEVSDVLTVMSALPEPARSVIVLRDVYDQTYADITRILEMPLSSVKVTLHRARRKVRGLLNEMETEPDA